MTKSKTPKGGDVKAPKGAGGVNSGKPAKNHSKPPIPIDDPRVQAFVRAIGDGADQRVAYDAAFGAGQNGKPRLPTSTNSLASRLAARPDVKAAIAELQKSRYIGNLWDAEKSAKVKLTALKMAKEAEDYGGMLKATESLDKQFGVGAPTKIELSGGLEVKTEIDVSGLSVAALAELVALGDAQGLL